MGCLGNDDVQIAHFDDQTARVLVGSRPKHCARGGFRGGSVGHYGDHLGKGVVIMVTQSVLGAIVP